MTLKTLGWTAILLGSSLTVAVAITVPDLAPTALVRTTSDLPGITLLEVGQGGEHQAGLIVYDAKRYGLPPAGGPHNPVWQNCGVYAKPIASEYAVHALEHGVVWVAYHPGLPKAVLDKLKGVVKGNPRAILSPYPKLPAQVVATAWGVQKRYNGYGAEVGRFITLYSSAEGSKAPEFGAPCQGGTSDPDSRQ